MMRSLPIRMSLIVLLLAASAVCAQPPSLSDVSGEIVEPLRTQLTKERAGLVQRRDAIAARVRTHNERCADVPEGSPAEAACATAQTQLSSAIVEYRAAVEAFNTTVAAAPRTKR